MPDVACSAPTKPKGDRLLPGKEPSSAFFYLALLRMESRKGRSLGEVGCGLRELSARTIREQRSSGFSLAHHRPRLCGLLNRSCQTVEYLREVFGVGVVFHRLADVIKKWTCLGVEISQLLFQIA